MSLATQQRYNVGGIYLQRPFKIRRLGHFGFNVDKLPEGREFYGDLLGFTASDTLDFSRAPWFPKDFAGPQVLTTHPATRRIAMAHDAGDALDGIKEPRLPTDGEVEAAVTVGDDVETCGFLRVDDRCHRVEILFAEQRLAQRRLERSTIEAEIEP